MHRTTLREHKAGRSPRFAILILLACVRRANSNELAARLAERVRGISKTVAFDHGFGAHNLNNTSNMPTWAARYVRFCRPVTVPSSIMLSIFQSGLSSDRADLDNTILGKPRQFAGSPCVTLSTSPLLVAGSGPGSRTGGSDHDWVTATTGRSRQMRMMALRAKEDPWMVLEVPRGST
eukprot:gnl/MRDRNA2_/MRDRNA2_481842_c0_seq1.p1 gnl/MRDRNA2_/MRDRNA2_481842_c0~~gnl/MRDRNA2_/MRDRNA2_481842_c0_seq1.p1  ORF type:complete len:185 (+),score=13.71 gnl/MRDRNA2_/MRDRNA2_481842_c0_seq1:24-557(+)